MSDGGKVFKLKLTFLGLLPGGDLETQNFQL